MSASPLPLTHFPGGDALSAFRAQALLPRLQAACPRITGVAARFVHWVAFDAAPTRADIDNRVYAARVEAVPKSVPTQEKRDRKSVV